MDFVRARTEEQMQTRQLDIMQACNTLFETGGYDAVNIKAISEMTSITRPSFYTYYKSKDEVLLDLLKEELLIWQEDMLKMMEKTKTMTVQDFSNALTALLMTKDKMLHLYSFLFTLLEQNCRLEKLVTFKQEIMPAMATFTQSILFYFPNYTKDEAALISTQIFSYVLGLYPMSHLTEKQREAVELAHMNYQSPTFEPLCKAGILAFLR